MEPTLQQPNASALLFKVPSNQTQIRPLQQEQISFPSYLAVLLLLLLLPLLLNFLQLLQQGHSNSLIFQMYVLFIEMDKGDVPIWKEYFQLWNMQRASYMEYVYYAYVTIICFRKYVVTSRYPTCISKTRISS